MDKKKILSQIFYSLLITIPLFVMVFSVTTLFNNAGGVLAAPLTGADLDVSAYHTYLNLTWTDDTTDANDGDTADVNWSEMMGPMNHYFGHATNQFDRVYFDVSSANNSDGAVSFYYWNGTASTSLSYTYSTAPTSVFNSVGINYIEFTPPGNWAQHSLNGVSGYYVWIENCDVGCRYTMGSPGIDQISLREYVSNNAPTATAITPSQTNATTVSVTTTIADADSDVTSLVVEYSTDNATWVSSTLFTATENSEGDGTTTSTGNIADIDTDNDGSIALTFTWNVGADLADTDDTTVYIRVVPNDGTVNGTTVTSNAFALDTADPSVPSGLTITTVATTSLMFTLPTTTSTDTNFGEYKIYYKEGSSGVATTDTAYTSSTDSNLGSATFSDATTTTIHGLSQSTQYVFNIWALDSFGNSISAVAEVTTTTYTVPTVVGFTTANGSTDFSAVTDITAVEDLTLATASGQIVWSEAVNADGEDYDSLVTIGSDYVTVDAGSADTSLNSSATITLTVDSCDPVPTVYYTDGVFGNARSIIEDGSVCNSNTSPACTSISCSGNTLTFVVPHFDSYAVQQVFHSGGSIIHTLPKPEAVIFLINEGATKTVQREVSLTFNIGNAHEIALSNTEDFLGAAFIPFEEQMIWTLSEGVGEKTIYARFRSEAGRTTDASKNISYEPISVEDGLVEVDSSIDEKIAIVEEGEDSVSIGECLLQKNKPYKYAESNGVYYITDNCTKREIKNPDVYFSYFDSWDDIIIIKKVELDGIALDILGSLKIGPRQKLKDGALIKIISSPKVYYIFGTEKHWIDTDIVFNTFGFVWKNIITISETLFDKYTEGESFSGVVDLRDGMVIQYVDSTKLYVLHENAGTGVIEKIAIDDGDWGELLHFDLNSIILLTDDVVFLDSSMNFAEYIKK
jgi:hypothetical protein